MYDLSIKSRDRKGGTMNGKRIGGLEQIGVGAGAMEGENRLKHGLQPQFFPDFVNGMIAVRRYLPPLHGVALRKRGYGFGVKARLPGNGIGVFGAYRAEFPGGGRFRRYRPELKYNPPYRNFGRHINSQAVAGGYLYSLFHVHIKEYSIKSREGKGGMNNGACG
jgi:hypothetical protein